MSLLTTMSDIRYMLDKDEILFLIDKSSNNIAHTFCKIDNLSMFTDIKFSTCNKNLAITQTHQLYFYVNKNLHHVDDDVVVLLSNSLYLTRSNYVRYIYWNELEKCVKIKNDPFNGSFMAKHKYVNEYNFVLMASGELYVYDKYMSKIIFNFKDVSKFSIRFSLWFYKLYVVINGELWYYNIMNGNIYETFKIMSNADKKIIINYPYVMDVTNNKLYHLRLYDKKNPIQFVTDVLNVKFLQKNNSFMSTHYLNTDKKTFVLVKPDTINNKTVLQEIKNSQIKSNHIYYIDSKYNLWFGGTIIKRNVCINNNNKKYMCY